MNPEEWNEAAKAFKDLENKIYGMLILAARTDLAEDADPCTMCGKFLVPFGVWKEMPVEYRPTFFAGASGTQGLCASCAGKERARNKRTERIGGPLTDEQVQRLRAAVNYKGRGQ